MILPNLPIGGGAMKPKDLARLAVERPKAIGDSVRALETPAADRV
jgi:hypothetical protein